MEKIERYFPVGNKAKVHKRLLVEAVFYLVDSGCKWRYLPKDFPKYKTVQWTVLR